MPEASTVQPPASRSRSGTLAGRTALVTCLVAVLSVLVTALVAVPVAARAANRDARRTLDREAALVADLLATHGGDGEALGRRMRARGIDVRLVTSGLPDRAGLPPRIVRALAAGRVVPAQVGMVDGLPRLVAGRPVPERPGAAVALVTRPTTGTWRLVWSRLWLALLAGLGAGLAAGPLLARRLARPLREAARAATRLSRGERGVRITAAGPVETAELATAINGLATALATSEGRQRDFLLSVSHELRTPLTSIRGYAEALADGVVGPDGAQRAGRTMLDEATRLDRLISDLLVLARLEAADLPIEPIDADLVQLVTAAGEAWGGRYAAAGVPLRVEAPAAPVPVRTDPGRVRQILDGLLENALRVVPPGAPVVIAARAPGTTPVPGVGAAPGWTAVEIRDGGPGLSDDDLAVAFERGALYQRYRGIRKVGSGLGLALAARLARRLGGTIEAGHAPEGGARFTVRLPSGGPTGPYEARTSP